MEPAHETRSFDRFAATRKPIKQRPSYSGGSQRRLSSLSSLATASGKVCEPVSSACQQPSRNVVHGDVGDRHFSDVVGQNLVTNDDLNANNIMKDRNEDSSESNNVIGVSKRKSDLSTSVEKESNCSKASHESVPLLQPEWAGLHEAGVDGNLWTDDATHTAVDGNLRTDDATHTAVDGNLRTDDATHTAVDGNLRTDDAAHTAVDGNLRTDDATHTAVDGNLRTNDATHTAVDGNLRTDDATHNAVDGNLRTDDATHTAVDGNLRTDDATHNAVDGNLRTNDATHTAVDGNLRTNDATHSAVDGNLRTDDATHTAVDGNLRTDDATHTAVDGNLRTEDATHTAVDGNLRTNDATNDATHTAVDGNLRTDDATHSAVGGNLRTNDATHTAVDGNLRTEDATHTAVDGNLRTDDATHMGSKAFTKKTLMNKTMNKVRAVSKPSIDIHRKLSDKGETSVLWGSGAERPLRVVVGVELTVINGAEPVTASPTVQSLNDAIGKSNWPPSCQSVAVNTATSTAGDSCLEPSTTKNTSACETNNVGNVGPGKRGQHCKADRDSQCDECIRNRTQCIDTSSASGGSNKQTNGIGEAYHDTYHCKLSEVGHMPIHSMLHYAGLQSAHILRNGREVDRHTAAAYDGCRRDKPPDAPLMDSSSSSSAQSCDHPATAEHTQVPDVAAPPLPCMEGRQRDQQGADRCSTFEALNSQLGQNIRARMSYGQLKDHGDEISTSGVYVRQHRVSEDSGGAEHCPLLDTSPETGDLFGRLHDQIRRNRENPLSDTYYDVQGNHLPANVNDLCPGHIPEDTLRRRATNKPECDDVRVDSDGELSDEGDPLLGSYTQTTPQHDIHVEWKSLDAREESRNNDHQSPVGDCDDQDIFSSVASSRNADATGVGPYEEWDSSLRPGLESTQDEGKKDGYILVSTSPGSFRYVRTLIPDALWAVPPTPQNSPQPPSFLNMGSEVSLDKDGSNMHGLQGALDAHLSNDRVNQGNVHNPPHDPPPPGPGPDPAGMTLHEPDGDAGSPCKPSGSGLSLVTMGSQVRPNHLAASHLPPPSGSVDSQLTALTPHRAMEAAPSRQGASQQRALSAGSPGPQGPFPPATRMPRHQPDPMETMSSNLWVQGMTSPHWQHPHFAGEDANMGLMAEGSSSPPAQGNDFPSVNILDILLGRRTYSRSQHSLSVDSIDTSQNVSVSKPNIILEQKRESNPEKKKNIFEGRWASIIESRNSAKSKSDGKKPLNKKNTSEELWKEFQLDPRHSRIPPVMTEPPLVIGNSKTYADYVEGFLSDSSQEYESDDGGNPSSEDEKERNFIDVVSNAFKSRFMNDKRDYRIVNGIRERPRLFKQKTFTYGDYAPVLPNPELSSSPIRNVYTTDDIPETGNPFARRNNDIFRSLRDFVQRKRPNVNEDNTEPQVGNQASWSPGSIVRSVERGGSVRKHELRRHNTFHGTLGDQNANTEKKTSRSFLNSPIKSALNTSNEIRSGRTKSVPEKQGGSASDEVVNQLLEEAIASDIQNRVDIRHGVPQFDRYGFRAISLKGEQDLLARANALQQKSEQIKIKDADRDLTLAVKWENLLAGIQRLRDIRQSVELKNLIRLGIPTQHKEAVWNMCINYRVEQQRERLGAQYYPSLLERLESTTILNPAVKQIELDLLRTLPRNRHYEDLQSEGVPKLRRILLAYTQHNPDIGYCQGINRLAAIALLFLSEEDAFWALVCILDYIMPTDYYSPTLLAAQTDQRVLKDLVAEKLPRLQAHMEYHKVDLSLFTFNWFLTIFVDNIPPETFLRIWDSFLYEGSKVLFRFAIAFLKFKEEEILQQADSLALHRYMRGLGENFTKVDRLAQIAFNEINPFSMRHINAKRLTYNILVKQELAKLEAIRDEFRSSARCRSQEPNECFSDDDI